MAEKLYELTLAQKRHDPNRANPRHIVGNNLHVGNIRLLRGHWTRVSEWWYLKNQQTIKRYLDAGRILVRLPDGTILGESAPAPTDQPQTRGEPAPTDQPQTRGEPTPPPEPMVEKKPGGNVLGGDDFSIFGLRETKLKALKEVAKTYKDLVDLGIAGLIEQARLTTAQAEKVFEMAQQCLGQETST